MKTAVVGGAGGFIGGHLVSRLKQDGYWVVAIDRKQHEFKTVDADEFILGDLRDASFCIDAIDIAFDEVYQLAAEMGGAEFVYDGRHDATIPALGWAPSKSLRTWQADRAAQLHNCPFSVGLLRP